PHDVLRAVLPATLNVQYLEGDIEAMVLPTDLDVVVSAASVQWLVDVPGLLKRLSANLNDGGYVVLSTFGPEQYAEIRQLTGQGLRYYSVAEWRALLSAEY